jgi:hypothetical protein
MLAREIWVLGIGKTLATAMNSSDMLACPAVDSVIERFAFQLLKYKYGLDDIKLIVTHSARAERRLKLAYRCIIKSADKDVAGPIEPARSSFFMGGKPGSNLQ